MNLLATTSILALLTGSAFAAGDNEVRTAAQNRPARRRSTHMWMFGANGVSVFNPDGSEEVKTIEADKVCRNVTSSSGSSRIRCDFYDVVSDGQKYVWAAVASGVPKIDIFRIDTGDLVGSFDTCGSPRDLDYHPLREEIWVHCGDFSDVEASHMDVFSAVAPSAPISTTIKLHDNTALRSSGKLEVHASLGDVAYSTVTGHPTLFKIDLAERRVLEEFNLASDNPKFHGVYDIVYSPVNGHLYARSEVCCTCGFEGADRLECGKYGSKNITIQGETTEGQCGSHCRGGITDTIGVIEFDTNTDTVVGTHRFVGSAPVYAPFASPDGKHIVMFGLDGGRTVEILKAGESGQKSELEFTLSLDFNTTNVEDYQVFYDFAYVQFNGINCFVVSSASDYKVAVVNMDTLETSYIMLKDVPYDSRRRSRQIEWAEGTQFVWIGGRIDKEAYVIDLEKMELIRTFTDVDARKFLSVAHHEFNFLAEELSGMMMPAVSTQESSMSDDSTSNDHLSVVALALSCIAIAAVVASLFVKNGGVKSTPQESAIGAGGKSVDPSLMVPPSVN